MPILLCLEWWEIKMDKKLCFTKSYIVPEWSGIKSKLMSYSKNPGQTAALVCQGGFESDVNCVLEMPIRWYQQNFTSYAILWNHKLQKTNEELIQQNQNVSDWN